jgi:alanyl aminopeptidase
VTEGLLPANVRPLAYRLSLDIDPNKPTFSGHVEIEAEWALPSPQVVLNGVGLTVIAASIEDRGRPVTAAVTARRSSGSEANDELVLTAPAPLLAGKHVIRLAYESAYPTDLAGLYRTKEDGRWYVFSQFESIDARRAFPCFDQPGYKTPFSIRVSVPEGIKAVSNTPVESETSEKGRRHFQFATTKPLPSYLIAFAIGDLDILELPRSPSDGETSTPVRFIAVKGKGAMGKRALKETTKLVGAFERYLGVPFPYPKLDIVAVPDFASGGMENAGLILCRAEVMALAPDAPRSVERHQSRLLGHEIAHQWFGDLVTAKWWDDIWLNEAFASWAEATVLGEIEPAIGNRLDTIANAKGVIAQDSLPSARPIRSDVRVAAAASETFDAFTYDKGAAILEMVRGWIGDSAFRKGLATYFEKHAHKNATSADLFSALEDSSHKPVAQVVRPYIDEPGSPLLVASRKAAGIVVNHWNDTQAPPLRGHPAHPLPLCVSNGATVATVTKGTALGPESRCALVEPKKPWEVRLPPGTWAYPNAAESAYGQVVPDRTLASDLVKNVDLLASGEQMGLVDSTVTGFELGLLPFATVDELFRRLSYASTGRRTRADGHLEPRAIAFKADALLRMLTAARAAKHPALEEFEQWVRARALPHKETLGWTPTDGEEAPVQAARSAILNLLAEVGDPATLQAGLDYTSQWLKGEKVDRDVLPTAFAIAARSPKAPLDAMWHRAMTTSDPQMRVALLQASTGTADPDALTHALDRSLTDSVKVSELRYILAGAFDNVRGHATVYAWVKAHWDALNARASWLLARRLGGLFRTTCTREEVADARAFFTPRAKPANARRINLGLEAAERCVALGSQALAATEVLQVLRASR